jgi:hypothetical protein
MVLLPTYLSVLYLVGLWDMYVRYTDCTKYFRPSLGLSIPGIFQIALSLALQYVATFVLRSSMYIYEVVHTEKIDFKREAAAHSMSMFENFMVAAKIYF